MHAYLRAIGFSNIKREAEAEDILLDVFRNYDSREFVRDEGKYFFLELRKEYAPGMGIVLCGELDGEGFHRQCYYPYLEADGISTTSMPEMDKRIRGDSYAGLCEDVRMGVSIIFFTQNPAEYEKKTMLQGEMWKREGVTLTGLSDYGTILFPMKKSVQQPVLQKSSARKVKSIPYSDTKDQEGEMMFPELDDMDLYAMATRRMMKEDLYTIVDTSFMPYGLECDKYHVIGNIERVEHVVNARTEEGIYKLGLECNGIHMDVAINEKDLLGAPQVGRRFKGSIWLQGKIQFHERECL